MEWQPIETAPKDGTEIIIFGADTGMGPNDEPHTSRGVVTMAFWFKPWGGWETFNGAWVLGATYWLPLPPPPIVS